MKKEIVLKFKIIEANDFGITGVLIQNSNILKRSTDTAYSSGYNFPGWDFINKKLYTYGDEKYDNLIFTVPKEDINLFLDKIFCINEKYGLLKRWRAEKGGIYWFIDSDFTGKVRDLWDQRSTDENVRYNLGNYFKTKEEAEKVKEELDKFWERVRNEEIGG